MTSQIATYFTKNENNLKNIVLRANKLCKVQQLFLKSLEPGLRNHVRLAAIEQTSALIIADSPAQAHQLHFNTMKLLEIFATIPETRHVCKIRVKTGYWPTNENPGMTPAPLSTPSRSRPSFTAQRQQLKALLHKPTG